MIFSIPTRCTFFYIFFIKRLNFYCFLVFSVVCKCFVNMLISVLELGLIKILGSSYVKIGGLHMMILSCVMREF